MKLFDDSNRPNLPDELKDTFDEIIDIGIKVFAKSNNMGQAEVAKLFEEKLSKVSIKIVNVENTTSESSEREKQLRFVHGLTDCIVNPEKPEQDVRKNIYLNSFVLLDKNSLKSTLMHEIYHVVLAGDKLERRGLNYVFNMGCSESVFENGECKSQTGHMMHEAMVARMQKEFCKKMNIPFYDKGLLGSGYAEAMKLLKNYEKIIGKKILPITKMSLIEMMFGEDSRNFAKMLDEKKYMECDEFLNQIDNRILPKIIRSIKNNSIDFYKKINTIFKSKRGGILLPEQTSKEVQENGNQVLNVNEEKTKVDKFRKRISDDGRLSNLSNTSINNSESKDRNDGELSSKNVNSKRKDSHNDELSI